MQYTYNVPDIINILIPVSFSGNFAVYARGRARQSSKYNKDILRIYKLLAVRRLFSIIYICFRTVTAIFCVGQF